MTLEIGIVLAVLTGAVIMFATERYPVDVVAIIAMSVLVVSGVITPAQGVSGFSNSATITVAFMFVLSAALFKSGAVVNIGNRIAQLFKYNFWLGIFVTMITVGVISAFINNTPVVAIFIPILVGAAAQSKLSLAKMLMPLSFASMFGGVCTLIGTSTNILVSGVAEEHGLEPFSMFEMSRMGIIFFGVGLLYMMLIGIRLIPDRGVEEGLMKKFGMGDYLTEIILTENAPSVGKTIKNCPLVNKLDIDILEVKRDGQLFITPSGEMVLQGGDILKVRCNVEKIKMLKEREGIILKSDAKFKDETESADPKKGDNNIVFVEAVIAPNSPFEGKSVKELHFRQKYAATVLAIRHRGELMREKVANTTLRAGDTLLIEVEKDRLYNLQQLELKGRNTFLIVNEVDFPEYRKDKMLTVVLTLIGVILLASLEIMPIMMAAITGSMFLVITKCITMEEAYNAIDWKVIFLLAGAISLGVALDVTGAARMISLFLIEIIGSLGPVAILSVLYIITSLMTESMSNNASAVLLAPIAIATAFELGVDPRPFLMAIAFAASSSFMTPVGYQTNTMIYGVGGFKFADFIRVGAPLNIIFWILATFLLPVFFPF
ncbi:MAG: sodium-coupled transporter [Bacteroidia bacterium]|nr:MAG: sodium-coupled transporter [Bacteroidia bacterium]